MSTPAPTQSGTSAPVRLFVIVVAIAVVLTLTIAYLGINGKLGLGIPGEKPPPSKSSTGQLRTEPVGPGALSTAKATSIHPSAGAARPG
jgi:hypothetical protein